MTTTTIKRLTRSNIIAIEAVIREDDRWTVTETTATFAGTPVAARASITGAQARLALEGRTGRSTRNSLHAPLRKLRALDSDPFAPHVVVKED